MIMRGGGAIGADGLGGAAGICVTLLDIVPGAFAVTLGTVGAAVAEGGVARGGAVIGGGAVLVEDGALVAGGVVGVLGGITTTDGGRYVAATEAGVTSLEVDGDCVSVAVSAGFGGNAFGAADDDGGADGASALVSTAGGFATERAAGGSTAALRCWIARNTSPGCEMWERSILVLISSSPVPMP
jgi:hypothetical protein